ncbi:MAG TPA: carbon monoxide accessory protein, partial [Actinomycetes bacterium]|nr:carbon monoxide accessory protein [Actinomycetes bacterium]
MQEAEAALGRDLVGFGRLLRRRGVGTGPDQVIRYRRALALLDAGDLEDLYWAGRTCLLSGQDQVDAYDRSFAEYFLGRAAGAPARPPPGAEPG